MTKINKSPSTNTTIRTPDGGSINGNLSGSHYGNGGGYSVKYGKNQKNQAGWTRLTVRGRDTHGHIYAQSEAGLLGVGRKTRIYDPKNPNQVVEYTKTWKNQLFNQPPTRTVRNVKPEYRNNSLVLKDAKGK